MTEPAPAKPLYLDTEHGQVFGVLHPAAPDAWSGASVLIVPPWGWDEVVSYRSRRAWADHLAASGHTALRIDLPGAGDSAGTDDDTDRASAWTAAVTAAVRYLRGLAGCTRVAVIGMGLAGLTVGRAIDGGANVDDLVLWAAPTTGRSFTREMKAFSGLQADRFSLTGEPEPVLLPDGWLEVGGFVLSAETIAALNALDATRFSFRGVRRALLLGRDGIANDGALRTHLEDIGAEVSVGPGAGWTAMCADIEQYRPPVEVFAAVGTFLANAPTVASATSATHSPISEAAPGAPAAAESTRSSADVRVGRDVVRETPLVMEGPSGRTFGVLVEPGRATHAGLCAVFLNAGAVRRIGPNRMWVAATRRWAARGVPAFRLDIEGIGDADGDPSVFRDVNAFYRAGLEAQIIAALDVLESRGLGNRFALVGLCSGAYWAFQVAIRDERVAAIGMLNPRTLIWDPHVFTRLAARDARKVLRRDSWGRFLRGRIGPQRLAQVARAVAIRLRDDAARRVARLLDRGPGPETVEQLLGRLDRRGTSFLLAFSDEESFGAWCEDEGLPARFQSWPNGRWVRLPGRDHTLRPIVAQAAAQASLDHLLDAQMETGEAALGRLASPGPEQRRAPVS